MFVQASEYKKNSEVYRSGGHNSKYYPGALSLSRVIATHLKNGYRSSNELQWLDKD